MARSGLPGISWLSSTWCPRVLILVAGAATAQVIPNLLADAFLVDWGRAVATWMTTTPLAPYAARFRVYSLYLADAIPSLAGGAIVGFSARKHWLRSTILYVTGYLVGTYADIPITAIRTLGVVLLPPWYSRYSLTLVLQEVLAIVPAAAGGAWVASRPRRRRHARRAAGLCASCGYNLTGNVSGRCPECGAATTTRRDEVPP